MRRLTTPLGLMALLAVMTSLAGFVATAAPRLLNRVEDTALRQAIAEAPASARDLTVVSDLDPDTLTGLAAARDGIESALPGVLRRAVSNRWYAVQTEPEAAIADFFPDFEGQPPSLDVRVQDGFEDAVRLTEGELPAAPRPPTDLREPLRLETVVSTETAEVLNLRVGSEFQVPIPVPGSLPIRVRITGLFQARDPDAAIWLDHPQTLHPVVPRPLIGPTTYLGTVVAHPDAATALWAAAKWPAEVLFRYRLDPRRLHAGQVDSLLAALGRVDAGGHGISGGFLRSGLRHLIEGFAEQRAVVAAVVAVVWAGILTAMLAVMLMAAGLAAIRRRAELALWRARGASLPGLAVRLTGGAALLLVPAGVAGAALAMLIPARDAGVPWVAAAFGVTAVLALPALAVPPLRHTDRTPVRGEHALFRPSIQRLTAELTLVVLAGVAVVLLRRRGLFQASGVDPYLSSVPVLVTLAVALVMLRVYPWPLRLASRFATRSRGGVAFLGTARASRAAPAAALPLVMLVLAVSIGVFSGLVRESVAEARDRAAWHEVGADVRVRGVAFDPAAATKFAQIPGVRAVAAVVHERTSRLYGPNNANLGIGSAVVLAVDAPAYQRVLHAAGIDLRLADPLTRAAPGDRELPALVSPNVARRAQRGTVRLLSGRYRFRVAGTVTSFPMRGTDTRSFVILPLQAMPPSSRLLATDFVFAGTGIDLSRLRSVANAEQRKTVRRISPRAAEQLGVPAVHTRAQRRAEAERSHLNLALTVAFAAGTGGATGFAVLGTALLLVVGAANRRDPVSRLRTLGLPTAGLRGLLLWETVPLTAIAVLTGTAVGAALPWLLGPALGLERFSGGGEPRILLDPVTVVGMAGIVALLVGVAIVLEARRALTPLTGEET